MKKLISILVILSSISLYSQNIESAGGLLINRFHDFNYDGGHYKSTYDNGLGYSFLIGIENFGLDDKNVKWIRLRLTLSYDRYNGDIDVYSGGLGGGGSTRASIEKSTVSLGIFPLNFRIRNRVDLNFGFIISRLVSETFSGSRSGWMIGRPGYYFDLNDSYDSFSSIMYYGIKGRVAYDFGISDTFVISPQYSFYLGLSGEFTEFPYKTKSMRHFFGLGFEYRINSNRARDENESFIAAYAHSDHIALLQKRAR